MAFKLQPLALHSVEGDFLNVYAKVIKNNLQHASADPKRVLHLRASQLPFCPHNFFNTYARQGMVQPMDFLFTYYVSVGTVVHEVVQTYLGQTGRFLADWECPECGKWHRLTRQPNCCGTHSKYHEVSIDYKGVQGHIDAIFIDKDGRYWILDFKTSSLAGAPKKKTNPGVAYIEQIETYAYFLWKQYGIKVHGVMLCFIPRDNPTKPVIYARKMKKLDFTAVKERFTEYRKAHKKALDVLTKADVADLVNTYGACTNPWCDVCSKAKTKKDRKKLLLAARAIGKKNKTVPIRKMAEKAAAKRSKNV